MRLQEALTYDDLDSSESNPNVQLNLCRIERYLNGPPTTVPSQAGFIIHSPCAFYIMLPELPRHV